MMRVSLGCDRILAFAVAVVLGASLYAESTLEAQDQTPPIEQRADRAAEPSAAAAGNRMTIDVTVMDKLGHHVDGLQAGDFTLLDNKAPQKIVAFRPLGDRAGADPVHVVIVVDMINTGFGEVAWERQQLDNFLKQDGGKLEYPTSIAVFADRGAKLQRAATQDGNALMASFDKSQTELRTVTRDAGFYGAAERLDTSLSQLNQLSAVEAAQPGRKLFLVISGGWPLLAVAGDQADMKQRAWVFNSIVELTNGFRAARITLYCLDPFELGRTSPFYYQGYLKGVASARQAEYPNLALQVLAEHSGGQVLVQGKDIAGDLNRAVRDESAGYELTFESSPGDRANEYHALQVQVDKPNVKVRTVLGYYARPEREDGKTVR
ncbi:MAG: VWA domain-containing protein [Terracidiphilus sp.]